MPTASTLELAERLFREAWNRRVRIAESEANRLKKRSRQIESEIQAFLDRIVRTHSEVTVRAYEKRINELQSEKVVIDNQTQVLASPKLSFSQTFELSMRFLANPYEIWKKGGIAIKRSVLRMVFARSPPVSGKLSAALFFLYFSGGRDRTMTWDIHQNEKRLC